MSRRPVIADTNVVVAGLLTGNPVSPVARILDGMLTAAFPFVVSEALLAEYRKVLVRPALRKLHGLTITEVDALLTDLVLQAIVLSPGTGTLAPDTGAQLLWDLLAARTDLVLITGDRALPEDAAMQSRLLSPREFIEG